MLDQDIYTLEQEESFYHIKQLLVKHTGMRS